MTALTRKAFRDIGREPARSALIIASITFSVAAVFALLGSYAILTRELKRGYLATNPASAILHTNGVDQRMLGIALATSEVGTAQARRIVAGRIKAGPAQWHNLLLFVIPNYRDIRLNQFLPEEGAWPPTRGEVLIERDAFQVARAKVGDVITLRTDDGNTHTLRVGGRVHDVGQAQARMENSVYGYITTDTLAEVGEKPILDLLLIQVASEKYNQEHIRQVTARLRGRLIAAGYRVDGIDFPEPGKHPHADLMAALLLAISSFGFLLLGLSGVLVLNFMAALMSRQMRQIGVMKTLGGTGWQIARIYLLQSLLLGSVATVMAIPAGTWGCHLLCAYLAGFLNFDVTSFMIPVWVFLLSAGAGIALPVLACALPVWRGLAIPVRRALASTGAISENFGVGPIDRMLTRVGGLKRPMLMAVRNSFRRPVRLVLTWLTLTCAATLFMTGLDVRASMSTTFDRLFSAERYDMSLYLEKTYPVDKADIALRTVPGLHIWENWAVTDGVDPVRNVQFTVIAMPPDSKLLAPVMTQGRSLHEGDLDSVVLNPTMAARYPQIRVGDKLRFQIGTLDKNWRVVGICREPMLPPPAVYVPLKAVDSSHSGITNLIQVALKDSTNSSLEQARAQIDPVLDRQGIHVSGARSKAEFRHAVDEHLLMIYVFQVLAAAIVAGVGALGLITVMGMNVLERRREIGVLRAIGATPIMISAIVVGEALSIAALAWIAAVPLAFPLTEALTLLIGNLLHGGFDFTVAPMGIVIALGASTVTAVLASVAAASSVVRATVRDALAYE
jgi:putative ABC transport system permease protein